jgi:hypothetical protein
MPNPDSQLPDFILADLFRQNLVDTGDTVFHREKQSVQPVQAADRKWFLGGNLQKITLLVKDSQAVFLDDPSLDFLSAILGACKLNLGDVAIVNTIQDPLSYSILREKLQPRVLLLFGVTAQEVELPFRIPQYQIQDYDQCKIVLAPALSAMQGDTKEAKLEKSKLWLSLKKIFGI